MTAVNATSGLGDVKTYVQKILHFSQLMENKISTIERGAFQDLKELERL